MQRAAEPLGVSHLWWISSAAGVGLFGSFLLSDRLRVPTAYHLHHVIPIGLFLGLYVRRKALPVGAILRRRLGPALAIGVLGRLALAWRVWGGPPSGGSRRNRGV